MSRLAVPVLATALLLLAVAAAPAATTKTPAPKSWATVNVCDTVAHPDTIGLRGSMPAGHRASARMWMRFAVQYRTATKTWKLAPGLSTAYVPLGRANVASRQGGHSFKVKAPAAGGSFLLRGVVSFQWRTKQGKVLRFVRRVTTAGHKSTLGADPDGYSAATCLIKG